MHPLFKNKNLKFSDPDSSPMSRRRGGKKHTTVNNTSGQHVFLDYYEDHIMPHSCPDYEEIERKQESIWKSLFDAAVNSIVSDGLPHNRIYSKLAQMLIEKGIKTNDIVQTKEKVILHLPHKYISMNYRQGSVWLSISNRPPKHHDVSKWTTQNVADCFEYVANNFAAALEKHMALELEKRKGEKTRELNRMFLEVSLEDFFKEQSLDYRLIFSQEICFLLIPISETKTYCIRFHHQQASKLLDKLSDMIENPIDYIGDYADFDVTIISREYNLGWNMERIIDLFVDKEDFGNY